MTFLVYNNLSALGAFSKKIGVTANNIANAETDGFKKSRAVLKEGERNDVQVEIQRDESPGAVVYEDQDGEMVERELSNVDIGEELTHTITILNGYKANLKMVKAQDEMIGTLIDLIT